MKITFLLTGKTKKDFIEEGIRMYEERIRHYVPFRIAELAETKQSGKTGESAIKESEGKQILKYLSREDDVILLDERGKMMSSVEFAGFIHKKSIGPARNIVFIAGGAYGFSQSVYDRANSMVSLSVMTFSHQIVRIIFLEQLYRAFTIIRNEPYHHG
jgi:23S rRNA (pseudouridine1915-N3)-methyltransferase